MKRIDVAIGIICREQQILIARRKADDSFGGYWEFPGGKVEPGETTEVALLRELVEELDLVCRVVESLTPFEHVYPQTTVRLHPFIVHPVSGEAKAIDSDEIAWIDPALLHEYKFPPANRDLIADVQRRFRV